jgi:predicted Zn-dependent peptidase
MYQRSVLDNGIRIVTEEISHVRSVCLGIWVSAGSRHEIGREQGISHFIEHMLFKGTETRTARGIAEEFDSIGGQVNAFTSREYTCFYAKVLDTHLPLAVDILADMLLNSKLDDEDVEKERGVVLEELKLYEDAPDELVHDLFAQAAWDGHALGTNVLGTVETVSGFTSDKVKSYMDKWYKPCNIVVSVAGNCRHDEVVSLLNAKFGSLAASGILGTVAPPDDFNNRCLGKEKDVEQVHVCIGGPSVPRCHPERFALLALDVILGGGMSSRLFQELREERGLVYSTYSYHASYQDCGIFAIYAGMSPENLPTVIDLMRKEMSKARIKGFTDTEISRAKEQLKGNLVLGLEGTSNRMSRLAKMELFYDRLYTPDEVMGRIDAVTSGKVHELSEQILLEDGLAMGLVGPLAKDEISDMTGMFITPVVMA